MQRHTDSVMQTVLEQHDVPVVGTDWLQACMKVKLRVPFNQYFTPALQDCTLSFTNLAKRARTRYQKDIEDLGGSVAPDMSKKCSHLVVGDASKPSSKLRCARASKLQSIIPSICYLVIGRVQSFFVGLHMNGLFLLSPSTGWRRPYS